MRVIVGDCVERLRDLPAGHVQTCVTSPPYFGLRDYGTGEWEGGDAGCEHRQDTRHQQQGATSARAGRANVESQRNENFRDVCGVCGARRVDRQVGLESSPDEYVARLVTVFREVRRVLRDDGTLWLNIGDSYAGSSQSRMVGNFPSAKSTLTTNNGRGPKAGDKYSALSGQQIAVHPKGQTRTGNIPIGAAYKAKDLLMIPAQIALALRADGWYLRSEIVWSKPNPMPESVTDRPTSAHEKLFLLSKSPRYFYDADAIREPWADARQGDSGRYVSASYRGVRSSQGEPSADRTCTAKPQVAGRNRRNVWEIATQPFPEAHFATFPAKLVEPCILASTAPGDVVLDPFAGSGTVGVVCGWYGREFVGIELNPEYALMAERRIAAEGGLGRRAYRPEPVSVAQLGFEEL